MFDSVADQEYDAWYCRPQLALCHIAEVAMPIGRKILRPIHRLALKYCWLEPTVFMAILFAIIWFVSPSLRGLHPVIVALILLALPVFSMILHRDRFRNIGLRFDNIGQSSGEVLLLTMLLGGVILLIGAWSGRTIRIGAIAPMSILAYWPWSLSQQFVLQGFVLRRLNESILTGHQAAFASACLFGAVHLPNPLLTVATTIAAYGWCRLFQRHPNLFTIALSQAFLAVLLMAQFNGMHHLMRVGPGFLDP